jgi:hypothetical protein
MNTLTEGPVLITGRSSHSCGLFKSHLHNNTDTVIVTGGNTDGYHGNTVEFLNLDSNVWTPGKGPLHNAISDIGHILFLRILYHIPYHSQTSRKSDINYIPTENT